MTSHSNNIKALLGKRHRIQSVQIPKALVQTDADARKRKSPAQVLEGVNSMQLVQSAGIMPENKRNKKVQKKLEGSVSSLFSSDE